MFQGLFFFVFLLEWNALGPSWPVKRWLIEAFGIISKEILRNESWTSARAVIFVLYEKPQPEVAVSYTIHRNCSSPCYKSSEISCNVLSRLQQHWYVGVSTENLQTSRIEIPVQISSQHGGEMLFWYCNWWKPKRKDRVWGT